MPTAEGLAVRLAAVVSVRLLSRRQLLKLSGAGGAFLFVQRLGLTGRALEAMEILPGRRT